MGLEMLNLVLTIVADISMGACIVYLLRVTKRRRDVEAFKHLLWQWYASQRDSEEKRVGSETADQALAAVLAEFGRK